MMEKSTGISQALLAPMAARMLSKSQCQAKVDGWQARPSSQGHSSGIFTQHATTTVASWKGG